MIGDGPESAIIGDEAAYLHLARTMIGVLFEAKLERAEGEYEVHPTEQGGCCSNMIKSEINDWHSHLNLMAL